MKGVKFRGGAIKHDMIWVYGYYVKCRGHHYILQDYGDNGYDDRWETSEWIEVACNTVGQYTCLKDKNDAEIFEGDILRVRLNAEKTANLHVEFVDGHFGAGSYFLPVILHEAEIAGNIYENEELLK